MNTNTALIVLTTRLSLRATIVCVNKSVTCSVISYLCKGNRGVLDVVFRTQVVLQLQGSAYKQKELTRKSSFLITALVKAC